jgi:hypothetical protein
LLLAATGEAVGLLLLLLSAVLIFFAAWAWRLRKGIRVRPRLFVLFTLLYALLFALVEAEVLRLPWGGAARGAVLLDLLLLAIGIVPAYRYTTRTTTLERAPSGLWSYRGRLAVPTAWLAFFLLRYGVELQLLGRIYLLAPSAPSSVPLPTYAAALVLVDALFSLSTGLVMGHSLAIYRAYRRRRSAPDLSPVPPVPAGASTTPAADPNDP